MAEQNSNYIFDQTGAQRIVKAVRSVEQSYQNAPPQAGGGGGEYRAFWFGELKTDLEAEGTAECYMLIRDKDTSTWERSTETRTVCSSPFQDEEDETLDAGTRVFVLSVFGVSVVLIARCP